LQARPIATGGRALPAVEPLGAALARARERLACLAGPHPYIKGRRSIFGVMPDWNPAEIIGVKPRTLALTLYRELVTDSIWAYQRDNYGYRNLRSFPLMVSLLGTPYIDVRVSFNSFIPKGVRDELAEKLAHHYTDALAAAPHAHDKVEFDIVYSCFYPGLPGRIGGLERGGFSGLEIGEILAELRLLTNRIIHPREGLFHADLKKVEELKVRHAALSASSLDRVSRIWWLIEYCKRYGTLPFSGLARAAFVAVQFLQAFVREGIFTPGEGARFLGSLDTVTHQMKRDLARVASGEAPFAGFLERYGHLRPGTYDILSPRYDEAPERYFDRANLGADAEPAERFELTRAAEDRINAMLRSQGLDTTAAELVRFMKLVIEGREYAKFEFTRVLSDALREIATLGADHGLSREDMSHVSVKTLLDLYPRVDAIEVGEELARDVERNRRAHATTELVRMPELIVEGGDLEQFFVSPSAPNFITLGRVQGPVVLEADLDRGGLKGAVVFIRAADPGYDWIFSRGIRGLVTQFGGVNSHMSIRCAELGIPAVIGCGEVHYQAWSRARTLEIDAANQRVTVLR
jgi:glutamine kinase